MADCKLNKKIKNADKKFINILYSQEQYQT